MNITVLKATVIQNKGQDVIVLETNLQSPFGQMVGSNATLTVVTPPDAGRSYCINVLGLDPQLIDVRT